MSTSREKRDLLVMKLLHYFITEKNYNPVVVHGIQNEIWLENMDSDIRIVRIVMGYIHNKEQLDFDDFKVTRLVKQIKMEFPLIAIITQSQKGLHSVLGLLQKVLPNLLQMQVIM